MKSNNFGTKLANVIYETRIGVYAIILNNNELLGVVKTPTGYFLPGGGLEANESQIECLNRECLEEIGYEISIQTYIGRAGLYHQARDGRYLNGIGEFYLITLLNQIEVETESDHEFIWLQPEIFIKNPFYNIKPMPYLVF